jgi:thioredoxin-like negative regulator of GroEL
MLVALLAFWFVSRPLGAPPGWGSDFDAAVKEAATTSKNVLVAFHSENCPPCVAMDRTVLRADVVQKTISTFVPVRVDITESPRVAAMFGVFATPTYVILSPEGKLLAQTKGYQSEEEMLRFFQAAKFAQPPSP